MAEQALVAAPEVPTTDEAGAPGLHMTFWYGLGRRTARRTTSSPSSTPRWSRPSPIRRCASGLPKSGHDIPPREQQTPEALGAHHKAEIEKWWPMIKAANIKAN